MPWKKLKKENKEKWKCAENQRNKHDSEMKEGAANLEGGQRDSRQRREKPGRKKMKNQGSRESTPKAAAQESLPETTRKEGLKLTTRGKVTLH